MAPTVNTAPLMVAAVVVLCLLHGAVAWQCWTPWNDLNAPRASPCSAMVNGNAYLLGGMTQMANGSSRSSSTTNVGIQVDNPLTWGAFTPDLPAPMNGPFCSYHDNVIYAYKGSGSATPESQLWELYKLNLGGSAWESLGSPAGNRINTAIQSSFEPPRVFLFGGTDMSGKPLRSVEMYDEETGGWSTLTATMPSEGCSCHAVGHVRTLSLICRMCNNQLSNPLQLIIMAFDTEKLTFLPSVSYFTGQPLTASLTVQAMSHYVITVVVYLSTIIEPVFYYTDLFSGQTMEITTKYISHQRADGALIPLGTQMLYAGGVDTNGFVVDQVDSIPALPTFTASVSRANRTYSVGEMIPARSQSCRPGQMIRLATTPRCDRQLPGSVDVPCGANVTRSGNKIALLRASAPTPSAYLCVSMGVCPQDSSKQTACTSSSRGENTNFENCLYNGCCWNNRTGFCFEYTDGSDDDKYYFNVDTDPIVVLALPTENNKSLFKRFFTSIPGIITAVVVGLLLITLIVVLVMRRRLVAKLTEEGSTHPLDQHSKYRVLTKLGQGGFGTVYLVARKSDGEKFALKYIICKDEEERDYAIKEFELIRSAQGHPNMITISDMFMNWSEENPENLSFATNSSGGNSRKSKRHTKVLPKGSSVSTKSVAMSLNDDGHKPLLQLAPKYVCIVMDYCPEGDFCQYILRQRLAGRKVAERTIVNVFAKQCCSMLMHLHSLQPPIVHRDLKPENILLKDNGEKMIVTDFGLAQQVEKSFMTTRAGSLHYVAPECWKRHYTVAVDNWAVGCIMYGAATGRVTPDTARVMFSDARERSFKMDIEYDLREYSPLLRKVVLGLLESDPAKRWTSKMVIDAIEKSEKE